MRASEFTYPSDDIMQCPYQFYDALRGEGPVYHVPGTDNYLISDYELCVEVLRNTRDFSSVRPWEKPTHPDAVAVLENEGWKQHHLLSGTDPPEHTRLRKIAAQAFTARRIKQLTLRVREFSQQLLDGFVQDGHVEFMDGFAEILPLLVIADMLGVKDADIPKIRHWSDSIVELTAGQISVEREIELTRELVAFQHFLFGQINRWREDPDDGFLGDIIGARDESGTGLDDANIIDLARLFLAAGHETTMQLIGNCFHLLMQYPGEAARLHNDAAAIPNFVEEVLRYESAVTRIHRVAARDIEFHGFTIPKGGRVLPLIGAANRDPGHYAKPGEFAPSRDQAEEHLAFGWGMHMCLGAPLARVEAIVALETLLPALKNLRLDIGKNDFRYRRIITRRSLQELHLVWDVD